MTEQEISRLYSEMQRRKRGVPPKRFWTQDEDRIALDMRKRGATHSKIGRFLGRTGHAVHARLRDYAGREA